MAMTTKAIAKRIKSSGLKKLKHYCQMCNKQCRDDNGFKCHLNSESHNRMMKLFAESAGEYLTQFSKEFEQAFMDVARRRARVRILANRVYNEVIQDRHHLHMNATQWTTLSDFVQHLGKTGQCEVEHSDQGWYIQYRDPIEAKWEKERERQAKRALDDEARHQIILQEQIERAGAAAGSASAEAASELQRASDDEKVTLSLGAPAPVASKLAGTKRAALNFLAQLDQPPVVADEQSSAASAPKRRRFAQEQAGSGSTLESLMREHERQELRKNDQRLEHWLFKGVIVKILNKKLADGKYHKQKAEVLEVIDNFVAELRMLKLGDVLRIDQSQLETVIPNLGKPVLILNGRCRGQRAELQAVDQNKFCASLKLTQGPLAGEILHGVAFEDFSKLA